MFDCAEGSPVAKACCFNAVSAKLRQLGFVPPPLQRNGRTLLCGRSLPVSVQSVTDACNRAELFRRRLSELARLNVPVCLMPVDFGDRDAAVDAWQALCEITAEALMKSAHGNRAIATCIHSHQLPLEAYCLVADSLLGSGERYVLLDSVHMKPRPDRDPREPAKSGWTFLWRRSASTRPVMPVYAGFVKSACPLLGDEVAASVLPVGGLNVPAGSAWVPVTVPLTSFADVDGRVNEERLHAALGRAMDIIDPVLEQLQWPDPRQRLDARQNRRMAFVLTGLGDLVWRSGRDPTDLACLDRLGNLLERIRSRLHGSSARLAARHGPLPALSMNPARNFGNGAHRDSWDRRWTSALRRAAVRHRNLVVMSPYSVLPSEAAFTPAFTDLLPLIAHADAWCFADPPSFAGWNVTRFRQFHQRARAIIHGSHAASFVAAGV